MSAMASDRLCGFAFRIDFKFGYPLNPAATNMPSMMLHPQVVTNYLHEELQKNAGRVPLFLRPPSPPHQHIQGHLKVDVESVYYPDRMCSVLYVPVAAHKREGPATWMIVLGIKINKLACQWINSSIYACY